MAAENTSLVVAEQKVTSLLLDQNTLTQLAQALPKHLSAERIARLALTEFRGNPKLMACEPASILACVVKAASLGLEFGGALGHIYMIPFGREATVVIGYKGLIDLATRSARVSSIKAVSVRERDEFQVFEGTEQRIHHVTPRGDRGALTDFYAIAHMRDGSKMFVVMSAAEVNAIRDKSKNGRSGPWVDHYEEMGKKTIIRRLSKVLPLSTEIQSALEQADAIDAEYEVLDEGDRRVNTNTGEVLQAPGQMAIDSMASAMPQDQGPSAPASEVEENRARAELVRVFGERWAVAGSSEQEKAKAFCIEAIGKASTKGLMKGEIQELNHALAAMPTFGADVPEGGF